MTTKLPREIKVPPELELTLSAFSDEVRNGTASRHENLFGTRALTFLVLFSKHRKLETVTREAGLPLRSGRIIVDVCLRVLREVYRHNPVLIGAHERDT